MSLGPLQLLYAHGCIYRRTLHFHAYRFDKRMASIRHTELWACHFVSILESIFAFSLLEQFCSFRTSFMGNLVFLRSVHHQAMVHERSLRNNFVSIATTLTKARVSTETVITAHMPDECVYWNIPDLPAHCFNVRTAALRYRLLSRLHLAL